MFAGQVVPWRPQSVVRCPLLVECGSNPAFATRTLGNSHKPIPGEGKQETVLRIVRQKRSCPILSKTV